MNTRQIADAGVALVKGKLSRLGFQASVAADHGTEVWVDDRTSGLRAVVKVATNEKPKPGGGKGALAVDWWIREDVPADWIAFVDLSTECAWLMRKSELSELAQQRSGGRLHFYMYLDRNVETRTGLLNRVADFERYLLEARASAIHAQPNTR
jgi:hypothetical protein